MGFAVDQAYFACGAPAAGIASVSSTPDAVATTIVAANGPKVTVEFAGSVRHAVRAALQFVCNWCVGNEGSQASLWDRSFPRSLMVRATYSIVDGVGFRFQV